jgi:hypothetical protein
VLISTVLRIIASVNHVLSECGQWDRLTLFGHLF